MQHHVAHAPQHSSAPSIHTLKNNCHQLSQTQATKKKIKRSPTQTTTKKIQRHQKHQATTYSTHVHQIWHPLFAELYHDAVIERTCRLHDQYPHHQHTSHTKLKTTNQTCCNTHATTSKRLTYKLA